MRIRMAMIPCAILLLGLGLATAEAQRQAVAQNPADGAETSHPATADSGAGMDMGHCGGMGHCAGGQAKAAMPAGTLRITFAGKSADWTPTALAALPHKTITVHNAHTNAEETYSGVPLMDLLVRLGVPEKPHGKDMGLYLVAVGSDGYKAAYSVAEVNPDVHDATVIVADSVGGKPLGAEGPLKMVATGETRPARWVRNLVAVKVMAAQ